MRSNAALALALLLLACNTADKLIVPHDDASTSGPEPGTGGTFGPGTGGQGSPGTGGAFPGTGGQGSPGTGGGGFGPGTGGQAGPGSGGSGPGTGGQGGGSFGGAGGQGGGGLSPDAGAGGAGGSPEGTSCAELPACGLRTQCLCCPLGLRVSHCTCSTECTADDQCPASAPHCNVRKVMGVPVGQGFCTSPTFLCQW
jgi:hypothetical protein